MKMLTIKEIRQFYAQSSSLCSENEVIILEVFQICF
jgi:hypothetical protein